MIMIGMVPLFLRILLISSRPSNLGMRISVTTRFTSDVVEDSLMQGYHLQTDHLSPILGNDF